MYNPKKLIIYLFAYILATSCGSVEKSIKRGDAALALGEYAEAAGQYKKLISVHHPKKKLFEEKLLSKWGMPICATVTQHVLLGHSEMRNAIIIQTHSPFFISGQYAPIARRL